MTTAPHPVSERSWESLRTPEKLALKQASARLADDFAGLYGKETIERFLASSFDQFADHAKVTRFLPLLAERFAHQRLQALARVEGLHDDGKPVVLFLCTHNAGRSQMALGFFQALNPAAIAAMAERGIDISKEFPKPWTDETVRAADVVVTMGCGDACPIFPGKRYENWDVEDPAGQSVEDVRPIRDEVERRVRSLMASLDL
jgi:protein-tyrosine-phosphatase